MIKSRMAKIVGTAMAAALIFGTVAPMTANANGLDEKQTKIENINHEQYEYARQEVEEALNLLDNADLTNVENYDAMMAFAGTAKERLEQMESNQWVDELYRQVTEEIMPSADIALRLMNDMNELQNATGEDKEAWIDALNEAIIYSTENYLLNDETLRSSIDVLHVEAGLTGGVEKSQETNIDNEQYEYARQEVEEALNLLDNADLTNVENYDAMMAFAGTAKERLEQMESNQWVDELYRQVTEEIMPSADIALRLMNDMNELQNATGEGKEAWIDALNEAIIYSTENYLTNDKTLRSSINLLHTEAGIK